MSGFAMSNIAWRPQDRAGAYALMREAGLTGLEIAPPLLFADSADPFRPTPAALSAAVAEVERAGLRLVSMQSLLFGVEGAALFGPPDARARFRDGLARAIVLAGRLSIPHLVLGAPRQRVIPAGMDLDLAERIAIDALRGLGDLALRHGARIGIEPNPGSWGANFLTDARAAAALARRADHPGLCMTLDIGCVRANGEAARFAEILRQTGDVVGHVHLSEPGLAPAPADAARAARMLRTLGAAGCGAWISVEMRAASPDPLGAVALALGRLAQARRIAGGAP